MGKDIIAAAVAFAAGVLVAALNYLISKAVLQKSPEKFSFVTILRQVIQIAFLVLAFFASQKLELNMVYPFVGAVVGLTVPMLFFTKKLVSFNEKLKSENKKKGDETDG